jgi:alkanesulfonate monooxygenase SsuD/methylene tetrahydromethanopterin reductase-like flavin-dependent oxidoreductase (luciferase family)
LLGQKFCAMLAAMKYAINLGACADPRTLGEMAHLAEEVGWDGIFLEDYVVYQNRQDIPAFDPWIALAAMAMSTENIRLGTEVTPLARRRPWKLARETVSLDHLSNGRLILGVGLGNAADSDFATFGEVLDNRQRAEVLDEALDILVGLWSGQPFSYDGKHFQIREVTFVPTPVQCPRIPIWIGGGWPKKGPALRAARFDGACLFKYTAAKTSERMTPADVRALRELIESRRVAQPAGSVHTPFDIVVGGHERRVDWEEERDFIRSLREAGATWWVEWLPPGEVGEMKRCIERGPVRAG